MAQSPAQSPAQAAWPELSYAAWKDTAATLQLWTQIVGKIRLARTPWLNHSWHVTLYATARGLTTGPIPDGARTFQIDFDFIDHILWLRTSDGQFRQLMLRPMSVAEFYANMMIALGELGLATKINTMPCELAQCEAFERDTAHASYDADAVNRFWRVLLAANRVFAHFRTGFLGKSSPVHFFWGSFDLAVTRFSGRRAPERVGADPITREAYSHEVISAGWWPGGGDIAGPAFYAYAAPEPEGFTKQPVRPEKAFYHPELKEFLLMYDDLRQASSPRAELLDFLQSTYEAGANTGNWNRSELERPSIRGYSFG